MADTTWHSDTELDSGAERALTDVIAARKDQIARRRDAGKADHLHILAIAFDEGWNTIPGPMLESLTVDEVAKLAHEAGAQAAANAAWRRHLGELLDTEAVTSLLGISRQALDSRKKTGSVLALPGTRTSHYPVWQFDTSEMPATTRPITLRIVTAFREALDDVTPLTIAGWATSPQPELDERSPAEWIVDGGDDRPVVLAARRAAHLEAM